MSREKLPAFDLKAARETRNLSQAAAATILCTTQASVSRWEAAGNLPAIYRKAWVQHWQVEENSNANSRTNEHANRDSEQPRESRNKAKGRARRSKRRTTKLRERTSERGTELSVCNTAAE